MTGAREGRSAGAKTLVLGPSLAALLLLSMMLVARPAHADTITVTNTSDPGDGVCNVACNLREAITASNASTAANDTIEFDIPGTDVKTISLDSALPTITDQVTINGYSQEGAAVNTNPSTANNAVLKIELDGANTGFSSEGLAISGSGAVGTRVRGLVINDFGNNGVLVQAGAVSIDGNFIGTDPSGTIDQGNADDGVRVTSSGNLVGGTSDASQNVISGNGGHGVSVLGSGGTSNVISNNHIGTDADAEVDLGNSGSGVFTSAPGVRIGGGNRVGGISAETNIISGNDGNGVTIDNIFSEGTEVLSNFIGADASGDGTLGNGGDGVRVSSSPRNEIGRADEGNIISGNGENGLEIVGTSSTFNVVAANRVGTDSGGNSDDGNALNGIHLGNASNTTVGGVGAGARNVVSGNGGDGVVVGPSASNNRIEGNHIGTNVGGTSAIGNQQGVNITDGSGNSVGGPAVGAGNLISGNTGRGVLIAGEATNNRVEGNRIGTDVFGSADLGNGREGVEVFEGSNNVIGGTASRTGNIISGNDTDGVELNLGASNNRVQGNLIGTAQNGTSDLGNGEVGVLVRGPGNLVGGTVALARNIVSGNGGVGVSLLGAGASNTTVQGNLIGTRVDGTTPLPNFHGVFVSEASDNTIGGTVSAAANTISGNANQGVMVVGEGARRNGILRNSIFDNGTPGGLGIELNNDGVTPNDGKDPDSGPNQLQNFPVITSASTTWIEGKLNSRPRMSFTVQFFSNPQPNFPTGFGEGKTFLGEKTVRTNRRGKVSFAFTTTLPEGEVVTATATDAVGNTSEFSQARTAE